MMLQINGTKVLKSGTDFRMMSQLTLTFHEKSKKVDVDVQQVIINKKVPEDKEVKAIVREYESECACRASVAPSRPPIARFCVVQRR